MAQNKNKPRLVQKTLLTLLISSFFTANADNTATTMDKTRAEKELLGRTLFFDVNLSKNRTMSCATCHSPETGFVDQRGNGVDSMASLGDDGKSIGDRNAPTASYAKFSPHFQKNNGKNKDK